MRPCPGVGGRAARGAGEGHGPLPFFARTLGWRRLGAAARCGALKTGCLKGRVQSPAGRARARAARAAGMATLCWLVLPSLKRYGRKSRSKDRFWALDPTRFTPAAYQTVNQALAAVGVPPWSPVWDSRNSLSGLLSREELDSIVVRGARAMDKGSGGGSSASTFWLPAQAALGQVVGLALLELPRRCDGVLSWESQEQRFWHNTCSEKWRSRMVYFRVLDAVPIGDFADLGSPVKAAAIELFPVPAGASRLSLFSVTHVSDQMWRALPCACRPGCRTVADVISRWGALYKIVDLPGVCMRLWPPIAMSVLKKSWRWLGFSVPTLSRQLRKKKGCVFHELFKDVDFDDCGDLRDSAHGWDPGMDALQAQRRASVEAPVRLDMLACAVRKWPLKICDGGGEDQEDIEDICFSKEYVAEMVSWLEFYRDELTCPSQKTVARSSGRYGFEYRAAAMIRFIMVADLVTDNATLPALLKQALHLTVPDVVIDYCLESIRHVPHKSTISSHMFTLDAAYCLHWQAEWERLLRESDANGNLSIHYLADSSPQFGRDWLMQEVRIVPDVANALCFRAEILSLLPDDLDAGAGAEDEAGAAWKAWAESMDARTLQALTAKSRSLATSVVEHILIPTCLATRHGSAVHKLHNMLHALHIDAGSWELVASVLENVTTITSDQGAERLLESTPHTLRELASLGFLPSMGGGFSSGALGSL